MSNKDLRVPVLGKLADVDMGRERRLSGYVDKY